MINKFMDRLTWPNHSMISIFIKTLHNELQCYTSKHFPTNILTKTYNTTFAKTENSSLELSGWTVQASWPSQRWRSQETKPFTWRLHCIYPLHWVQVKILIHSKWRQQGGLACLSPNTKRIRRSRLFNAFYLLL